MKYYDTMVMKYYEKEIELGSGSLSEGYKAT